MAALCHMRIAEAPRGNELSAADASRLIFFLRIVNASKSANHRFRFYSLPQHSFRPWMGVASFPIERREE